MEPRNDLPSLFVLKLPPSAYDLSLGDLTLTAALHWGFSGLARVELDLSKFFQGVGSS